MPAPSAGPARRAGFAGEAEAAVVGLLHQPVNQQRVETTIPLARFRPRGIQLFAKNGAVGGTQDIQQPTANLAIGPGKALHLLPGPVVVGTAGALPGASIDDRALRTVRR